NPGPDGQQQRRQKGGITTTGYSLSSPQNCPNGRDHLSFISEMYFRVTESGFVGYLFMHAAS
ncbi:hypothetical protein, partial [Komagataeibacter swingsii]|uniref:hypothetical protein n=1 Tax=Komagataeibacter swingsii TaxID=215220 RepID=UPI001C4007EF